MGRIVSLVLGFGLSCLLVSGLLGLTEGFLPGWSMDAFSWIPASEPKGRLQTDKVEIKLPATVPGTDLIAERLVCYEGPFLEDGSDIPVVNVAALVIRNAGQSSIAEASVAVERAGEQLVFNLTYLLPGMSVMVLEQTAAPFFCDGITGIAGWERQLEDSDMDLSDLHLAALDMGHIAVTNPTGRLLEEISLYHKNHLPDGMFIGGITYQTTICELQPGETQTIFPEHYADGYSKIFYAENK